MELNTAEMTREDLESAANDLAIGFQGNTKDDTLRKKIDESLGSPSLDKPGDAGTAPQSARKEKRFEIIVATHERDKQPAQVSVNGRLYLIERGKKVIVPESVVKVLQTAVRDVYDPATMAKSEIMSYPFQTVREA